MQQENIKAAINAVLAHVNPNHYCSSCSVDITNIWWKSDRKEALIEWRAQTGNRHSKENMIWMHETSYKLHILDSKYSAWYIFILSINDINLTISLDIGHDWSEVFSLISIV